MNPYYEVVYPEVDKNKLVELAHMIKGIPLPTKGASSVTTTATKRPVLKLRRWGKGMTTTNRNAYQNVYGNNVESCKKL